MELDSELLDVADEEVVEELLDDELEELELDVDEELESDDELAVARPLFECPNETRMICEIFHQRRFAGTRLSADEEKAIVVLEKRCKFLRRFGSLRSLLFTNLCLVPLKRIMPP